MDYAGARKRRTTCLMRALNASDGLSNRRSDRPATRLGNGHVGNDRRYCPLPNRETDCGCSGSFGALSVSVSLA
jgi:hypothetical protein